MIFLSKSGKGLLDDSEREDIARRINTLTEQLADVRVNFGFVTDERLIDALIYEEKALLCRIESVHREAREQGVTIQPYER